MRSFIFTIFFGADEMASRMFALLKLRQLALKKHAQCKKLAAKLTTGKDTLAKHKGAYDENREALEKAYTLNLDEI